MSTPANRVLPFGSAYVQFGDPTTADGANMLNLGQQPSVTVTIDPQVAFPLAVGGRKNASSAFTRGVVATVEVTFDYFSFDLLTSAFPGIIAATSNTDGDSGYSVTETFTQLTLPTMVVIPPTVTFSAAAASDPDTIWFPAVAPSGEIKAFTYTDPGTGGSENFYTLTFEAFDRSTDQGTAPIPAGARHMFFGAPSLYGLTWSIEDTPPS